MTIKPGDRIPQAEFATMTADGQQKLSTDVVFDGRKVVLFARAWRLHAHLQHESPAGLPARSSMRIKAKGVDTVACTAVNDVHVMNAWAKATGRRRQDHDAGRRQWRIRARPSASNVDLAEAGMGERSRRYSMIVDNGVVKTLNVEDKPGVNVSGAETILQSALAELPARLLEGAMPWRASSSARSLSSWPAWPFTQCQEIVWRCKRRIEALPELGILHRLLVRRLPAIALPAVNPFADAVLHIGGIDMHLDRARTIERFQRHDRRHQLHAVVGGLRLAAGKLLARAVIVENGAPAAGAGIAGTGAVAYER